MLSAIGAPLPWTTPSSISTSKLTLPKWQPLLDAWVPERALSYRCGQHLLFFFVLGLPQTTWFLLIRIQTALIQTNILSVAQKYFFCKESHVVCITCKYYRNDPVKYDLNFCSLQATCTRVTSFLSGTDFIFQTSAYDYA